MRVFLMLLWAAMLGCAPALAQTAWSDGAARALLAEVEASAGEGLRPADYGEARLRAALAAGEPVPLAAAAEASFLALGRDYAAGRTPEAARIGWKSPPPRADEAWLRERMAAGLQAGQPAEALRALLPAHPHYALLREALAKGGTAAEKAKLRANLDRWRWMPRQLGDRYLMANVPEFVVDLWEGGRPTARHRIIVGQKKTPTPQFSVVATAVIINPDWVIPDSIIRESVGALIRRSPGTARARGYRWQTVDGKLQVRQLPGAGNSLGTLKIEMPNPWAIYFHDTPAKHLFERDVRAFSHGCMRTQGILGLALRLLEDVPGWDAAKIDATAATNETVRVPLVHQLPAHVAYFTAVPVGVGGVRFLDDIYGRDAPVIAALAASGDVEAPRIEEPARP